MLWLVLPAGPGRSILSFDIGFPQKPKFFPKSLQWKNIFCSWVFALMLSVTHLKFISCLFLTVIISLLALVNTNVCHCILGYLALCPVQPTRQPSVRWGCRISDEEMHSTSLGAVGGWGQIRKTHWNIYHEQMLLLKMERPLL